jgi:anti-sigma factor RsiW
MVVSCEEVWAEISNYLDGDVEPSFRAAMEAHLHGCKHCSAVLDGTRNVIQLYGDERMLEVPLGFSRRLQRRLGDNRQGTRRTFFGWMVAAAAAVLVVGGFEVGKSAGMNSEMRSEHAQTASGIPPEINVIVSETGKVFHLAGCTFIHDKNRLRTIPASEAMREGYVPCVRCLGQYLS